MRKYVLWSMVICLTLLTVSFSLAEPTPREPQYSSTGKTTFTNLALTGLNNNGASDLNAGTPSYIEMVASDGDIWYLWIDSSDRLRMSSAVGVGYLASPATVGWQHASGQVVGLQVGP